MHSITGAVAPGFEEVREAFASTLSARPREGAAFAAYRDGRLVVDLAAGAVRPGGEPWGGDTRALVFSCTKAVAAVAALVLVERGLLDLDDPVERWWPGFGAEGKEGLLVGHVLAHTAGLPGIRRALRPEDLLDASLMESELERAAPWWEPGTQVCYHPLTFGWLLDGVVRRAAGAPLAQVVREHVARPLGLSLSIGLGPGEGADVARLSGPLPPIEAPRRFAAVYENPPVLAGPVDWWNGPALRAGIPAVGAVGSARDFARLFACLVGGGELDGARILSAQAVSAARAERSRGVDPVTGLEQAFGAGFALQTETLDYGPPADAFGHDGVGGSIHGGWPAQHVAFSYVTGVMRAGATEGRRILDALWACVCR
jgi:CubicO group peptidase (beta-lactamase class C family)